MKFKLELVVVAALFCALTGCNIGNAPSGMSNEDAKATIAKMKPEDKIRAIANSPMPGPEKEKQFAEIEQQTGVKAADVLGKSPVGAPGAGQANTGNK